MVMMMVMVMRKPHPHPSPENVRPRNNNHLRKMQLKPLSPNRKGPSLPNAVVESEGPCFCELYVAQLGQLTPLI